MFLHVDIRLCSGFSGWWNEIVKIFSSRLEFSKLSKIPLMKYRETLGIKSMETVHVKPSLHNLVLLKDEIKLMQREKEIKSKSVELTQFNLI